MFVVVYLRVGIIIYSGYRIVLSDTLGDRICVSIFSSFFLAIYFISFLFFIVIVDFNCYPMLFHSVLHCYY